jgi:uncharacterized phage protein (TIGR01671 family)
VNRKILFRGKNIKTDKWEYGSLLPLTIEDEPRYFIIPDGADARRSRALGEIQVEVYPGTIGQLTGLFDTGGRGIFEGDILKLVDGDRNTFFKVYWSIKDAGFYLENKYTRSWGRLERLLDLAAREADGGVVVVGNLADSLALLENLL